MTCFWWFQKHCAIFTDSLIIFHIHKISTLLLQILKYSIFPKYRYFMMNYIYLGCNCVQFIWLSGEQCHLWTTNCTKLEGSIVLMFFTHSGQTEGPKIWRIPVVRGRNQKKKVLKFIYSEKDIKFCEISTVNLTDPT